MGRSMNSHPPQLIPVLGVMVDEEHTAWVGLEIPQALQVGRALWFHCVHRQDDPTVVGREHDRNGVDTARGMDGCERPVAYSLHEPEARDFVQLGVRRPFVQCLSPQSLAR